MDPEYVIKNTITKNKMNARKKIIDHDAFEKYHML